MLAVEQDVGGLDVAVHEPDGVRGVERGADLQRDARDAAGRDAALAGEQALQVGPGHVAHDEVEVAALLAGRVDRDHVGMVDRRRDARLALEALAEAGIARPLGGDQLDGDGPAERQLGRAVDDAHAAAAGDRLDAAAGDLGAWEQIGHTADCDAAQRACRGRGRGRPRPRLRYGVTVTRAVMNGWIRQM